MSKHSHSIPPVEHKGIREPFSYNIIRKAVSQLFPLPNRSPSNEGSSIIGEFIYILALALFGRSIGSTGFAYDGTAHGNALFDAAKMIRILMYFFSNTIITIFFKDIETMYLNENHNIDEEFLGLGVTLRQIHGSLTNGLISFIYTLALNDGMVGGGMESSLEIDINEIVREFFIEMSFKEFEEILMMNRNDPYELRKAKTSANWNKSFSKLLMSSKQKTRDKSKKGNSKLELLKLKRKISELSPELKEREVNEVIELLEGQKPQKFNTGITLMGGADTSDIDDEYEDDSLIKRKKRMRKTKPLTSSSPPIKPKFNFPGNEGSDDEQKSKENNKYFYYKLFLLESMFNSDRFLDSFEVMFNLICRLINRLIKRLIPLIRRLSSKTLNNMGAFIFSLGGPFTEILWFGFSTMLSLLDVGETALDLGDDFEGSIPIRGEYGPQFVESAVLRGSEPKTLNDLLGILENLKKYRLQKGGGVCKHLKKFDKQIKDSFFYLF